MSWSTSELRVSLALWNRFKPSSKIFTDRSKAVLLLWIYYVFFCLMFAMPLCASVLCALWSPAGKRLTPWLSFVVSYCEFVTFPLVSWDRCVAWLYRFLIFAPLLTLTQLKLISYLHCLSRVRARQCDCTFLYLTPLISSEAFETYYKCVL